MAPIREVHMVPQGYPLSMQLVRGRVVGAWEVEEELGRGAMAVVYRVRHTALGTKAALKVLDRVDETTEKRLLAEGQAQGSVQHEGVVGVLDHLHIDGHAALLLEHVEGGDLARLLQQGALPLAEALELFRQLVEAVAAAHDAGLVHRDLKPSNVLIAARPDGTRLAKVGDFGLVKTTHGELTATHALMGTPRYMAPEQMRAARDVDVRADIFALGCILCELVCGRAPFTGDDLVELYSAKMGGRYPDPAELVPALPPEVLRALAGCLQGLPSRRIPSCRVLREVLDGQIWQGSSEETFEGLAALALCPCCGGPAEEDCPSCGAPATLAGRYRLVDALPPRAGRTTRLWRALDLREGAWVLIRALPRSADASVRARFERGARVQQELAHSQLARGIDGPFEEHDQIFEVREWIAGRSLQESLATHRYSEHEVLHLMLELCAPLRYLAERSPPVIHRALRPEHVLRAEDGRLVLIDLAQVRDTLADGSLHDVPEGAPEQWVGEATPATDVHGLGALAVTLLTRKPAHTLLQGGRVAWEGQARVSAGTARLLQAMLSPEPERRPSLTEVTRRLRTLLLAPSKLVPPRRWPLRRLIAAGLGTVMGGAALMCGGVGSLALIATVLEDGTSSIEQPEGPSPRRRLEPGADLAAQEVPATRCGPPFQVPLQLDAYEMRGQKLPLFALACDGELHALAELEIGPSHTVELPGPSELLSPLRDLTCEWPGGLRGACVLDAAPQDRLTVSLGDVRTLASVLDQGEPAAMRMWPGRQDHWEEGSDGRPLLYSPQHLSRDPWFSGLEPLQAGAEGLPWRPLFRGEGAVQVEGVFRKVSPMERGSDRLEYQLVPMRGEPYEVWVLTPQREPIADAEIRCSSGQSPHTLARTDARGRASCDPGPGEERWAVIQAPGRVAEVTQLVPPLVQVTLREARTVHVGCAGFPDGRCETMQTPPVCSGGLESSSGICRFSGGALVCECSPDTTELVHGVLGTVSLPSDRDQVWFDLRALPGRLEGRVQEAEGSCEVSLRTRNGALRFRSDDQGRFSVPYLPEGSYLIEGACTEAGRPRQLERRLVTVDAGVTSLDLRTRPIPVTPRRRPQPEQPTVERKLLRYEFPAWPSPEIPGESATCTARVTIDPQGRASDAVIHGCPDLFVLAARDSVLRWQWAPGEQTTTEELRVPFDVDRTETVVN
jgi:serine/threonine protein kinase